MHKTIVALIALVLVFGSINFVDAAPQAPTREQSVAANHGSCNKYAQVYVSSNPVTNISWSGGATACPYSSSITIRSELWYKCVCDAYWTFVGSVTKTTTGTNHYASSYYTRLCGGLSGKHMWVSKAFITGNDGTYVATSPVLYTYLQPGNC